ncbi:condensation domain-containing protein, partial [Amycolatopsis sp.]|uniref:condensation domain-containing protein n=1 Tax=Amycolatopsis sp. TaxID=37632 RepID=UPI002D7E625C
MRVSAPLSSGQQRLWTVSQLDGAGPAYNETMAFELRGPLDCGALQRAFDALADRHEALRTRIVVEDGRPVQVVEPAGNGFPCVVCDVTGRPEETAELRRREALAPFDLARAPLARARLLVGVGVQAGVAVGAGAEVSAEARLGAAAETRPEAEVPAGVGAGAGAEVPAGVGAGAETRAGAGAGAADAGAPPPGLHATGDHRQFPDGHHILLITVHHIVFDGWSRTLLLRELGLLYAAELNHTTADL